MKVKIIDCLEMKEILGKLLPNVRFKVYYENKNKRGQFVAKTKKEKMTLTKLATIVEDGFKQVNTRLDYIVRANNLKDLPKTK